MSTYYTVITRKGQITVPADIRRSLGMNQGDLVAVDQEGDSVRLRRSESIVARTAGMLAKYLEGPPRTIEEEKEATAMAIALDVVERMSRSE